MSSRDTMDLLRLRYPAKSFALFFEVQSATAYQGRQRADAVAMGLWPSRGLDVIGFEFKSNRSDWLRELKQPNKAEEIFQFCDRWYLVVSDGNIVKDGELPATWGMLVESGKVLREAKEAPRLEAKPIAREFLASLLRSAQNDRDKAASAPRAEIYRQVMDEVSKEHHEMLDAATIRGREKYEKLLSNVRAFKEASGIDLDIEWVRWDYSRIGNAIKLLDPDGNKGLLKLLDLSRSNLMAALHAMETAAVELSGWPGFPKQDGGAT